MGKVATGLSMSLDGFIAGPNDGPGSPLGDDGERLFAWYSGGDTEYGLPGTEMVFEVSPQSAELLREAHARMGAFVTGRRTFDIANGWGGSPPLGVPTFVVTHTVPHEWVYEGSPFTFATDGVESAVEQARAVAGDKDVAVGAASIAQQCIRAGLLDEIHVDLVPVLLGDGVRLFKHLGTGPIELESTRVKRTLPSASSSSDERGTRTNGTTQRAGTRRLESGRQELMNGKGDEVDDETKGRYAEVNGLEIYYEVHGSGEPLVLLHGAYMTIDAMGEVLPELAKSRQVVAVELQGHGRTADVDRPLTYEQMADDVAALLRHLDIEGADVFGFSMGGGVALQVAIRHPEVVRKLVVASASYTSDGMQPELHEMVPSITPEMFAGSPIEEAYLRTAPNPDDFPTLVAKLKQLDMESFAWPPEDVRGISAPTLLIIGDSDAIRLEHAVELFRLLGGGVMGDLAGLPKSQLAVLPGTTHFVPPGSGVLDRPDRLLSIIPPFLDAPMPEAVGE